MSGIAQFCQFTVVILLGASLVHDFLNWGRPRPVSFPASALGSGVLLALLIVGGFFG